MVDKQAAEIGQTLAPFSLCQVLRKYANTDRYISDFGNWRIGLFKEFLDNNRTKSILHLLILSLKNNEAVGIRLWSTLNYGTGTFEVHCFPEKGENRKIYNTYEGLKEITDINPNYLSMIDALKTNQPNFMLISGQYNYFPNRKSFWEYQRRLFLYDSDSKPQEIEWSILFKNLGDKHYSILLEYERNRGFWSGSKKLTYVHLDFQDDGFINNYSRAIYKYQTIELGELFAANRK